jgi:DNA-directed RNA polymerase sigma subunit (sigma70/sigma32)
MVHTYNQHVDNDFHKKELIDEMPYNVYKALLKYNPDKGAKFSTHLGNETKWLCLNKHSKNRKQKTFLLDDSTKSMLSCPNDSETKRLVNKEIVDKVLELAGNHPDKRVAKIFKMRYIIGNRNKVMPWKTISRSMDISVQGCINIHNSALTKIKTKLAKET